jgi:hypothetical protein
MVDSQEPESSEQERHAKIWNDFKLLHEDHTFGGVYNWSPYYDEPKFKQWSCYREGSNAIVLKVQTPVYGST